MMRSATLHTLDCRRAGRAQGYSRTAQTQTITSTQITTYTYDAANRLASRNVSDGHSYTYTWSARGQLLAEWQQGTAERTFTYNAAGQLAEATVLTLTTHFRYNGDGQRLNVEVVGTGTTTYTLDYAVPYRVLVEATAESTKLYLYGQACTAEWTTTDGWRYYLPNGEGRVRQIADGTGHITFVWRFNPDGGVLTGSKWVVSQLGCGDIYDWSTGLIYRNGRYFDPTLGIWLGMAGMVVIQSGQSRKKRRRARWLLLLLFVVCVGGLLTACANSTPGPSLDPAPCKEITPIGGALGNNALFIGPTSGNTLSEYPPALTWNANEKQTLGIELNEVLDQKFGGSAGFGSLPAALSELGISESNPIRVVRETFQAAGPNAPAAAARPYLYIYEPFFTTHSDPLLQRSNLAHEIGHYWDEAKDWDNKGGALSKEMRNFVNWGNTATDRGSQAPMEDFPEAVRVYFYFGPPFDEGRDWTDDAGDGFTNVAMKLGATGPDQLMLDANTMQPSATGTVQVQDRYDFLQLKFTGKWK